MIGDAFTGEPVGLGALVVALVALVTALRARARATGAIKSLRLRVGQIGRDHAGATPARTTGTEAGPALTASRQAPIFAETAAAPPRPQPAPFAEPGAELREAEVLQHLLDQIVPLREAAAHRASAPVTAAAAAEAPGELIAPPDIGDADRLADVVREAISADRIVLHAQPIVELPKRRLAYYECSPALRMHDGRLLGPELYLPALSAAGVAAAIDNLLLMRCVQLVRRARRRPQPLAFFCRISGETLRDRDFFVDFAGFMRDNRDLAGSLIFGVTQHDAYRLEPRTELALEQLAKLGFRFALEDVTQFDLFVSDLSARGYRFAKVAAATMLERIEGQSDQRAWRRTLDPGAIDLIISGIDRESHLLDLLDTGVDFGQGRLFGEPRPVEDWGP